MTYTTGPGIPLYLLVNFLRLQYDLGLGHHLLYHSLFLMNNSTPGIVVVLSTYGWELNIML